MRYLEHTAIHAVAGVLALVVGLTVGGCGGSQPSDNASNHNFEPCADGDVRCGSTDIVEQCEGGLWHPEVVCSDSDRQCVDGFCVGDNVSQVHWVRLQNGLDGYAGCTDISVPVPEGSGFYEVTPEDEQLYIYHYFFTGS